MGNQCCQDQKPNEELKAREQKPLKMTSHYSENKIDAQQTNARMSGAAKEEALLGESNAPKHQEEQEDESLASQKADPQRPVDQPSEHQNPSAGKEQEPEPGLKKAPTLNTKTSQNPHFPDSSDATLTDKMNELNDFSTKGIGQNQSFITALDEKQAQFEGLPHNGPYQYHDGTTYEGQFKNGKRHGKGKRVWPDGSFYLGYWFEDQSQGDGLQCYANGDIYKGQWREGKSHGFGEFFNHEDDITYKGEWVDGRQEGKGKEFYPDGATYEGDFFDSQKHGKGKLSWSDGSYYEGDFNQNNIEGVGTYVWNDQREYTGEWKDNKMSGVGVFKWVDGRIYEGSYENDLKHGKGKFTWPDGRKYKGTWVNGKQHGEGQFKDPSGKVRKGVWEMGTRVKWLN